MKDTFTSKMRGLGFNSKQIAYYRQKLYRSGFKANEISRISLVNFSFVRFYTNRFDGQALEYTIA